MKKTEKVNLNPVVNDTYGLKLRQAGIDQPGPVLGCADGGNITARRRGVMSFIGRWLLPK